MASFESYANKYKSVRMERRGGILQMTNRLHFPEGSGYYQPINTIRTDGTMWFTPSSDRPSAACAALARSRRMRRTARSTPAPTPEASRCLLGRSSFRRTR